MENSTCNNSVMEHVTQLEMYEEQCEICEGKKFISWFLVADVKPWKVMCVNVCNNCGPGDHSTFEYEILDYGVEIKFESRCFEEFKNRMCFINTEASVKVYRNKEFLVQFKCENAYVDSLSTFLGRIIDLLEGMMKQEESPALKNALNLVNSALNDGVIEIEINDETGYSKICPQNIEYTEVCDFSPEKFQERILEAGDEKIIKIKKIEKQMKEQNIPDSVKIKAEKMTESQK
ncbi:hypothetical protein NUSPORA_01750 [Nucleospora cyclopteri]